jgi:hypothetical protein
MTWNNASKKLNLRLADGSRFLQPTPRPIIVQLADAKQNITFNGDPVEASF